MKNTILILFAALMSMKGCDPPEQLSQEQEQKMLDTLYTEIQDLAGSEICTEASSWSFTAIGAKACGGPTGYIAYPQSIDTESFLQKVSDYTKKQDEFNKKWGIISDCSVPPEPSEVRCVDGKPEFTY